MCIRDSITRSKSEIEIRVVTSEFVTMDSGTLCISFDSEDGVGTCACV